MAKPPRFKRPSWWKGLNIDYPRSIDELWIHLRPYGTEVYRGLSDANYDLSPRIARNSGHLSNEWNMMSEFATYARSHGHEPNNHLEILALAQHHGLPTRCMDVTYAFGVALYFATVPTSSANGAVIWCISVDTLSDVVVEWFRRYHQGATDEISCEYTVFSSPPTLSGEKIIPISDDQAINTEIDRYMTSSPKPRHPPVLVGTSHVSHRMRAQDASFILLDPIGDHLGFQLSQLRYTDALRGIYLSPELCKESREHLRRMGINRRVLFPDIDNLAADIAEIYLV